MLQGDLQDMASVMWGSGKDKIYSIGLTERTYAQMSNRSDKTANNFQKKLGNGFGWVTNMENGSTIHGKYSFPGSDAALQGQDYPFPTVLRGTDSTGVTVNLHYGAWPKVGMLWNEGIVSLDLIADYVPSSGATKELKLNLFNVPEGTGTKSLEFTYSPDGVVTAKATKNETGDFAVTLKGEGTGAAEVIAKYGDYTARLMVTVTADLKVNLGAESVELLETKRPSNSRLLTRRIKRIQPPGQSPVMTRRWQRLPSLLVMRSRSRALPREKRSSASQRPAKWAARTTPPRRSCR